MNNKITNYIAIILFLISQNMVFAQNSNAVIIETPISNVEKTLENLGTGNVMKTNGNTFLNVENGNYSLTASKNLDFMTGVSTLDLLLIQRHILQFRQFENAYSFFAADVKRDHAINTLDLIQLRQLILGKISVLPNNESFIFGDGEQVFDTINYDFDFDLDESIEFTMNDEVITKSFIPIKIGDVDQSFFNGPTELPISNYLNDTEPKDYHIKKHAETRVDDTLTITIPSVDISNSTSVCIPVTTKNFTEVMGFQFPLSWNKDILKFDHFNFNSALSGVTVNNIGQGELLLLWSEITSNYIEIEDNTVIFEICFDVLDSSAGMSEIYFQGSHGFETGAYDLLNEIPYIFNGAEIIIVPGCADSYNLDLLAGTETVSLTGDELYIGATEGDVFLVNGMESIDFSCAELGSNEVVLTRTDTNNIVTTCIVEVIVRDKTVPEIIVLDEITISLNEDLEYILDPSELDNGSSDICGNISFSLTPSILSCDSENPATVTLYVSDESGNTISSTSLVHINYPVPADPPTCYNDLTIEVGNNEIIEITASMFTPIDLNTCDKYYTVSLSNLDGSMVQADNLVDISDSGNTYLVKVEDPVSGDYCQGRVNILGEESIIRFSVPHIQVEPNSNICIPVSVESFNGIGGFQFSLSWDNSVVNYSDIIIIEDQVTSDLLYNSNNSGEIIVVWTAADALPKDMEDAILFELCFDTGDTVGSTTDIYFGDAIDNQVVGTSSDLPAGFVNGSITLNYGNSNLLICDSLAWNTPLGDCASGHTEEDDVEWPADISVSNTIVNPIGLSLNVNINPNDVKPNIVQNNNAYTTSYEDQVIIVNDDQAILTRTWSVSTLGTLIVNQYVQTITINASFNGDNVCVSRPIGDAVADVNIIDNFNTDDSGCTQLENINDGTVLIPSKNDVWLDGVDILDKIVMLKGVLGMIEFTPYQLIAADMNEDGYISTIDVVILEKIVSGEIAPITESWKFVDGAYQFGFTDLNNVPTNYPNSLDFNSTLLGNHFVAMKMGDLDYSYEFPNFTENLPTTQMVLKDDILNKGEAYIIPISTKEVHALEGIQFSLDYDLDKIEIINVSSDILKGFDMDKHVIIKNGVLSMSYNASLDDIFDGGITVDNSTTLFNIEIKAKENGIISEIMFMDEAELNVLKSQTIETPYKLGLEWSEKVINKVDNSRLQAQVNLYPQPASDLVNISWVDGKHKNISYTITNIMGQKSKKAFLNNNQIEVSNLVDGIYLIELYHEDKILALEKLIISH